MNRLVIGGDHLVSMRVWADIIANGATTVEVWHQLDAICELVDHLGGVPMLPVDGLRPDATVAAFLAVGAPDAMAELPPSGDEIPIVAAALAQRIGRQLDAVVPLDLAGINAFWPLAAAAELGLPVIDSDGMGRMFPMVGQTTYALGGVAQCPMALAGASGEVVVIDAPLADTAERIMRASVRAAGGWMMAACYPMTLAELAGVGLTGMVSKALAAGAAIRSTSDLVQLEQVLARQVGARVLGRGRIVEISGRPTPGGTETLSHPSSVIVELLGDPARTLRLEVGDAPLLAFMDGALVAAVPDVLITLDVGTATVVEISRVAVGDRVSVLVLPASPEWHTPAGTRLAGPRAFGFPIDLQNGDGQ